MNNTFWFFILALLISPFAISQEIAVLKYKGGGDWYANPTALPNLIAFCNNTIHTTIDKSPKLVETGSIDIFQYPFVYMTGHGNVFFNHKDVENLRNYLLSGGFLHIDDNYGMALYVKRELRKLFPEKELIELAATHPIFHQNYIFPEGLPKIHEHEGNPPQAFGIFHNNRLLVLFTYESDLGDGWEDPEIHNDPQETRIKALQMGANIIAYVFTH